MRGYLEPVSMIARGDVLERGLCSAWASGLKDRFHHLLRGEGIDRDGDVGGAVKREATVIATGKIGLVGEDGAEMLSAAASGEGGGEFDFKVNEDCAGGGEEQRASGGVLDGAAA